MKMLKIEEVPANVALESIAETMALEAMGLSSIVNRVVDLVPTLVHSAKSFLSSVNRDKPDLAPLHLNKGVLERCFSNAPFSDIVTLSHPVPPGFEGNLYEYSEHLKKQVAYINELPSKLTAFNQFVSELISSPQARKTIKASADKFRAMAGTRKLLVAETRNFFGGATSRIANAKYGDVIGSNAQYLQFSENTVTLVEMANKTSFSDTEKLVRDSKELLEALAQVARDGQLTEMSNLAFDALGAYTETIAREVEMYSLVLFAVAELRACVEQGNAKLIQALRY